MRIEWVVDLRKERQRRVEDEEFKQRRQRMNILTLVEPKT
jgi:hypothetical protein